MFDVHVSRFHANKQEGVLLDEGAGGKVRDCDLSGNGSQNLRAAGPAQTTLTDNRIGDK